MTEFVDLCQVRAPRIRWVLVVTGFDTVTGGEVPFYTVKGDSFQEFADGELRSFRDAWADGQEIDWTEAITRAAEDADRSFLALGSTSSAEKSFKFKPDQQMLLRSTTIDFRGGSFKLYGWGPLKADGTEFPFPGDLMVRGVIVKANEVDGGIIDLRWKLEEPDFDEPVQDRLFGGFGTAARIKTPGSANPQEGTWANVTTSAFDVTASAMTIEMFILIENMGFLTSDYALFLNGPDFSDNGWGLIASAGNILKFASKTERITTTFIVSTSQWHHLTATVESDGKTVKVYAGLNKADPELVGEGVLVSALSPPVGASEIFIGNPGDGVNFITSGTEDQVWRYAEGRFWDRSLGLDELTGRGVKTLRADDPAPGLLHHYRAEGADVNVLMDERGAVDIDNLGQVLFPEFVSTGDGAADDIADTDVVGRTRPQIYGKIDNAPTHFLDPQFDNYFLSEIVTETHEIRVAEIPVTQDFSLTALFDIDATLETYTIVTVGVTFERFVTPDGDIMGQPIETIGFNPPVSNGVSTIVSISDDLRTITVDNVPGGNGTAELGTIRTPITGVSKFAVAIDNVAGQIVVDRGTLIQGGSITQRTTGVPGSGGMSTVSGIFENLVQIGLGIPGFGNVIQGANFLDVAPVGKYLALGGSQTFRRVASEIALSAFAGWRWEPDTEKFTLIGFVLPQGSAVAEIDEITIQEVTPIFRQRPFGTFNVRFAINYEQQDPSSAAGAVPSLNRQRWKAEGQTVPVINAGVESRTAVNRDEPIDTLIFAREQAEEVAQRMNAVIGEDISWHRIPIAGVKQMGLRSGDEIVVTWPDRGIGWEAGQNRIAASITRSTRNTITIETFGKSDSQTLSHNGVPITHLGEFIKEW